MTQKRELVPITVYLPPETVKWLEARGAPHVEPVSAVVRRIVMREQATEDRLTPHRPT